MFNCSYFKNILYLGANKKKVRMTLVPKLDLKLGKLHYFSTIGKVHTWNRGTNLVSNKPDKYIHENKL